MIVVDNSVICGFVISSDQEVLKSYPSLAIRLADYAAGR